MPEAEGKNVLLCQSCGMVLAATEHFGTNSDGTPAQEYCCFCYQKGRYTDELDIAGKIADSVSYHDEGEKHDGRTLTRNEMSVQLHLQYPKLRRWAAHRNTHTAYYEAVNRALEHIHDNLAGKITLRTLAKSACISEFHFHRIFSAVMGEAPGEYIQRLRLEKAAFLLSNGDSPIQTIAIQCGYETQQALGRAFRRHFGFTPGAYRKSPVEARFAVDESANLGVEPELLRQNTVSVSGVRVVNPLGNKTAFVDAWDRLRKLTADREAGEGDCILLSRDRSTITKPENYDIYACISPPVKERRLVNFKIEGGLFAVFTHKGAYTDLRKLYCHIYRWWLPYSGYRLRDTHYYEKFLNSPGNTPAEALLTEVWIPVEKQ